MAIRVFVFLTISQQTPDQIILGNGRLGARFLQPFRNLVASITGDVTRGTLMIAHFRIHNDRFPCRVTRKFFNQLG